MSFALYLDNNNLGGNSENIRLLTDFMSYYLPNNLQKLELGLSGNNLGANSENMAILAEGIKQLPS